MKIILTKKQVDKMILESIAAIEHKIERGEIEGNLEKAERIALGNIERNPELIKVLKNPTKDEMLLAVNLKPSTIQFIINKADSTIKMSALQKDPTVIQYFKDATNEELKFAIGALGFDKAKKLIHSNLYKTLIWIKQHPFIP